MRRSIQVAPKLPCSIVNDAVLELVYAMTVDRVSVQGSFCVLVGPSGSAKSSVLAAMLGDMLLTGGVCEVSGTCALAPQEPWLIADKIRDNIIMGSHVDEQRYQMV